MKKPKIEKVISSLTYGDSLDCLDSILEKLQKDDIPLEQLEEYYREAKIYLDHCEKLLNQIEQNILKINPEELID